MHDGIAVQKIPHIRGVGVFARRTFQKGDAVVRYFGATITLEEAKVRKTLRAQVCFVFLSSIVKWNNSLWR